MEKRIEARPAWIDLGEALVETKGQSQGLVNDGGIQPANKYTPSMDLSAD